MIYHSKFQFCWDCGGEYHTSSACVRPKIKVDSNAVLLFDEYDKQCANHFLARKVALKGKTESSRLWERSQRTDEASILRIISEGWSVLADAQSALAHSCIVLLNVKSAKLSFLFECQKAITQSLQQKFEENWTSLDRFPQLEAKSAIRDLRIRLRDYMLAVHTEIISDQNITKGSALRAALTSSISVSVPNSARGSPTKGTKIEKENFYDVANLPEESRLLCAAFGRICSTESMQDITNIATTIFGDAFGGSSHVYDGSYLDVLPFPPMNNKETSREDEATYSMKHSAADINRMMSELSFEFQQDSIFSDLADGSTFSIAGANLEIMAEDSGIERWDTDNLADEDDEV